MYLCCSTVPTVLTEAVTVFFFVFPQHCKCSVNPCRSLLCVLIKHRAARAKWNSMVIQITCPGNKHCLQHVTVHLCCLPCACALREQPECLPEGCTVKLQYLSCT